MKNGKLLYNCERKVTHIVQWWKSGGGGRVSALWQDE